ncbi:MAG: hypothetical protein NZZ41_01710 [Candidatus Dojkabacteria bacterium]|nr:hypothetical protein [Candidatus Dojkabacteria bacterium]
MPTIKGILNKDQLDVFLYPLNELIKVGAHKILLNFYDVEKKLGIYTKTQNSTNFIFIEYSPIFLENFNISKSLSFGIYNLPEFYNILKQLDCDVVLEISEEKIIIKENNFVINYFACQAKDTLSSEKQDLDKELLKQKSLAYCLFDENIKKFLQLMNSIKSEHCIVLGNKQKEEIYFIATNKNLNITNDLSLKINCSSIKNDFKIIFEKDKIYSVLSGIKYPCEIFFKEKVMCLTQENENFKIYHFLVSLKQ